jgi:hypothetical protein
VKAGCLGQALGESRAIGVGLGDEKTSGEVVAVHVPVPGLDQTLDLRGGLVGHRDHLLTMLVLEHLEGCGADLGDGTTQRVHLGLGLLHELGRSALSGLSGAGAL